MMRSRSRSVGCFSGIPLGGMDGVDAEHVHGVDLLQGAVLGLDHEEVDDEDEGQAAAGEDQAVPIVDLVCDEASAISMSD